MRRELDWCDWIGRTFFCCDNCVTCMFVCFLCPLALQELFSHRPVNEEAQPLHEH